MYKLAVTRFHSLSVHLHLRVDEGLSPASVLVYETFKRISSSKKRVAQYLEL